MKEIVNLGKYIERNFSDRGNVYWERGISPTLQAAMGTGGASCTDHIRTKD